MSLIFPAQAFYLNRNQEMNGKKPQRDFVGEFSRDFMAWYEDQLSHAKVLPKSDWMSLYSDFPGRVARNIVRRGIGVLYRSRKAYPDFTKARSHQEMAVLNALLSAVPRSNFADKLAVGAHIPAQWRDRVRTAKVHHVLAPDEPLGSVKLGSGQYFLKSNHGSGQYFTVDPDQSPEVTEHQNTTAKRWVAHGYGIRSCQWWYRKIAPKLFLEEDLNSQPGDVGLQDYKFHVINGRVAVLQVITGRQSERFDSIYDHDLNYLDGLHFVRRNKEEITLHPLTEMARDAALAIARPYTYMRVDFYLRGEEIILGEMTLLPNAGQRNVISPELDERLCEQWAPLPRATNIL